MAAQKNIAMSEVVFFLVMVSGRSSNGLYSHNSTGQP